MQQKLKVLDLFSGIGGFSLGLDRTGGFETVAFCEQNDFAQRVLKKHWPDVPVFEDVRTLDGEQFHGTVDVITGGFPCQDISLANSDADGLEGERSGLWFELCRLIDQVGPRWALIENVPALRSRGLGTVLQNLSAIGYDAEWNCIPASHLGAPHRRDRIWLVSYPNDSRGKAGANRRRREKGAVINWRCAGSDMAHSDSQRTQVSTERGQPAVELPGSNGATGRVENVADTTGKRCGETGQLRHFQSKKRITRRSKEYSNAQGKRLLGLRNAGSRQQDKLTGLLRGIKGEWAVEPAVGRVVNGLPNRMDRIKCLGNAIVPQIPEVIGNAILTVEASIQDASA